MPLFKDESRQEHRYYLDMSNNMNYARSDCCIAALIKQAKSETAKVKACEEAERDTPAEATPQQHKKTRKIVTYEVDPATHQVEWVAFEIKADAIGATLHGGVQTLSFDRPVLRFTPDSRAVQGLCQRLPCTFDSYVFEKPINK